MFPSEGLTILEIMYLMAMKIQLVTLATLQLKLALKLCIMIMIIWHVSSVKPLFFTVFSNEATALMNIVTWWSTNVWCSADLTFLSQRSMYSIVTKWHWSGSELQYDALDYTDPDSKDHGANMGPIWGRQDPGGPHVGPMNHAIWELIHADL